MLLACGGAAASLLAPDARLRYASMGVALIAAPALVAGDVWHQARFTDLRSEPALVVLGLAFLAAVIVSLAIIFRRLEWWGFPVAVFAALPLRLPVQIGGETSNLLIPLYAVIAGGVVSGAYAALCRPLTRERPPGGVLPGDSSWVRWTLRLLAATLLLYAVQTAYSEDVPNAIENACFFLVPFAVLAALLTEFRWSRRLLGFVLVAVAGMALVFAAIAFWEYAARDLILNKDLLDSNQLHLYFRVNSVFRDPNIFARYLALTIVALAAYVSWGRRPAVVAAAAVSTVPLLAALALTFSITSFGALIAGLLVIAALRWGLPWAVAAAAGVLVCGALILAVATPHLGTADQATSGRVDLVNGGIDLARDRPIGGWGSGSFGAAFARHIERARTTTSHNEPITIAAEQGAIGLGVYGGLILAALAALLSGVRRNVGRAAVAACFVAMIVHSLGYAGFITDPATWALLGVGVALQRQQRPVEGRTEARQAPAAEPPAAPATISS
jgi:O-antigen ligase